MLSCKIKCRNEVYEMIENDNFLINHAEEFLRAEEILKKQGRTK